MNTDSGYYGNCSWWLRSPSYNRSDDAGAVSFLGDAFYSSYVSYTYGGVVPALRIRL